MKLKTVVTGIVMLIVLMTTMLTFASNIQQAESSDEVYLFIRCVQVFIDAGTSDPEPNVNHTYTRGTIVEATAFPSEGCRFGYWHDHQYPEVKLHDNPISFVMDRDYYLDLWFFSDFTIEAYCVTEGEDVSVSFLVDGQSAPWYITPFTFVDAMWGYLITVPPHDPHGHPFVQWSTGGTSMTQWVWKTGTYTAKYWVPPPSLPSNFGKNGDPPLASNR